MNEQQRVAMAHPCLLGEECVHPRFRNVVGPYSIIVTVNSGYE